MLMEICAQILKVFASVRRVSMETHGVWLITETKSVTSVDTCVMERSLPLQQIIQPLVTT